MDNVPQRILVNTDTSSTTSSEGNRIRSPSSSNSSSNSLDRAMLKARGVVGQTLLHFYSLNQMPCFRPCHHYLYKMPRIINHCTHTQGHQGIHHQVSLQYHPIQVRVASAVRGMSIPCLNSIRMHLQMISLKNVEPAGNNSPIGNIRGGSISTGTPNSANSSRVGLDDFLESILNE